MQLLTLGVIGDYLGRVFTEVKGRPLYVIRDIVGMKIDGDEETVADIKTRTAVTGGHR
jgi:hypothetical protein